VEKDKVEPGNKFMKKAPLLDKGKGKKRMLLFRMRRNKIMVDEWAAVQLGYEQAAKLLGRDSIISLRACA
jgi:hypothetical protein